VEDATMIGPDEVAERVTAGGVARDAALGYEEVVARVRAGDLAVYELLVRRHNRAVYRACRALLRDDAEAEDAAQEAWVSAFARLSSFEGSARFGTWIVTIALNEARSRLRRRAVRTAAAAAGWTPEPEAAPGPEREVAMREAARLVEAAVDGLPAAYREVFVLRGVEGLSTEDAAAALGVSEDVVKTRLHRARTLLRDRLAGALEQAAPDAFGFLGARCDRIAALVMARIGRGARP
jgi:RNA polymerase sigma-70 factor (ECF subfamily)